MARWKARGRLPIDNNWTFFARYDGWGAMSRYRSKLRCLKGGWVTLNAHFRGTWAIPTNDFWHQKTRVPELSYGEKIAENFNRLSRVHQRYRQTDDSQTTDGRPIAYSEREREFTSAKNRRRENKITQKWRFSPKIKIVSNVYRTAVPWFIFRSTPRSRPNKVGLKFPPASPYVRPSVHKKFLGFYWTHWVCR